MTTRDLWRSRQLRGADAGQVMIDKRRSRHPTVDAGRRSETASPHRPRSTAVAAGGALVHSLGRACCCALPLPPTARRCFGRSLMPRTRGSHPRAIIPEASAKPDSTTLDALPGTTQPRLFFTRPLRDGFSGAGAMEGSRARNSYTEPIQRVSSKHMRDRATLELDAWPARRSRTRPNFEHQRAITRGHKFVHSMMRIKNDRHRRCELIGHRMRAIEELRDVVSRRAMI